MRGLVVISRPFLREFQSFCGVGGYCCSGVNHGNGNGPVSNGDCPFEAIIAVTSKNHMCVRNVTVGEHQTYR